MQKVLPKYQNLLEMLERRVEQDPQKIAYTFLKYEGLKKEEVNLTYKDVYENAKAVAFLLKKHGIQAGDRVIIFSTQTYDNIYSIFGAILAQAVFIIIPPPIDEGKRIRFKSVLESSKAKLILCNDMVAEKLEKSLFPKFIPRNFTKWVVKITKNLEVLSIESFKKKPENWVRPAITQETPIYLQYSSGSTNIPKGVKVNHKNVLHNIEGLQLFFGDIIPQTMVSWAPFFHNMGILSLVFTNIYIDARSVIMSPLSFVENPYDWFRAVTEYKGDLILGPNSAFDYCTRMISDEQLVKLDLSTVKYAANGSESINYKVLEAFSNKFSKCGFRHSAFCLGYGLAESTCFVSASRFCPGYVNIDYECFKTNQFKECSDDNSLIKQITAVGKPFEGIEVLIVNPDTSLPCTDNEIGELLLKGESIVDGYWENDEETNRVFKAAVEGEDGFYARTGDLAALYKGELYIAGRLKEIIIINGHNIVPQDIEMCVWDYVAEVKGCSVVSFAVDVEGKERFATCIELAEGTKFDYSKLCEKINLAIHKVFGICPFEILFLKDGTMPRTDNRKIQVLKTKELYESGKLNAIYSSSKITGDFGTHVTSDKKTDPMEDILLSMVELAVGSDAKISTEDNLFTAGMDSLAIVQLSALIEKEYGINLTVEDMVKNPTVQGVAHLLKSCAGELHHGRHRHDTSLLYDDCRLDAAIIPESDRYCGADKCKCIFVTGATGFIGAYLVKYLMKAADAEVFCLVRANNILEGFQRVKDNMKYYKLWDDSYQERLKPVIGDLSKPGLGMEECLYMDLSNKVDSIYHGGALLNFIYPYSFLRDVNVKGTVECLRFACKGKAKYFHYISTYSVYDNPSHFGRIALEDDKLDSAEGYFLPYSETKWVSEQLVTEARNRGLKAAIYRPGEVCGCKDTGIWKLNDMVSRFLAAGVKMGEMPDIPMNIHITPVDYIGESIVCLSMQEDSTGKAFNLVNKKIKKLNELPELINNFGYRIKLVPYENWKLKLADSDPTNSLYPLRSLFLLDKGGNESVISRYADLEAKLDTKNVIKGLADKNINCTPVCSELIFKYLGHFINMGYIEPPETEVEIKTGIRRNVCESSN